MIRKRKHVADAVSQARCTYERAWTGKPCTGYVDITHDYGLGLEVRLCPRHNAERYARNFWGRGSGALHKGKRKWWKR